MRRRSVIAGLLATSLLATPVGARMMRGGVASSIASATSLTINEFAVGYFGSYYSWSNLTISGTTVTDASSTNKFITSSGTVGNVGCVGKPLTINGASYIITSRASANQVTVDSAPGNGTGVSATLSYPGVVINRAPGSNARTVTVSGTYTGSTPSSADVQLTYAADCKVATPGNVFKVWTQLVNFSASAGTWQGDVSVGLCDDWVVAQVRDHYSNAVLSTKQSNYWGVGVVFLMAGQSNMARLNGQGAYFATQDSRTKLLDHSGWHSIFFDTNNTPGAPAWSGSFASTNTTVAMCNAIASAMNCVVGMLQFPISGAAVKQFLASPANGGYATNDPGNFWVNAASGGAGTVGASGGGTSSSDLAGLNSSSLVYGKDFEAVIWQQGETEAMASGFSGATYTTQVTAWRDQLLTLNGRTAAQLKFCLVPLGSGIGYVDADFDTIRRAQLDWLASNAAAGGVYGGTVLDATHNFSDATLSGDTIHWCNNDYAANDGPRYTQALLYAMGAQAHGADGPKCASAVWTAGNNYFDVTVTPDAGTALKDKAGSTSGSGTLGFSGLLNGSPFTVIGWAITSATTIRVTTNLTKSGVQAASFQYLPGANPLNATGGATALDAIYDNATIPGSSFGFPLEPTNGSVSIPP